MIGWVLYVTFTHVSQRGGDFAIRARPQICCLANRHVVLQEGPQVPILCQLKNKRTLESTQFCQGLRSQKASNGQQLAVPMFGCFGWILVWMP